MPKFAIGSLVRCREREWIVVPSPVEDVLMLRPLGGTEAETCGIYIPLEGNSVTSAEFDLPAPDHAGDFISGRLLRDAARLSLRSGAGPFRSLGHLDVRPRPYQLVPLIMALRLDPVRLLIADDVGIGKTIEAGLIARELLDRGEIRRLTVLCPPHLCDQWQRELADKFAIDAVVVRSSTAAKLERGLPRKDVSLFTYYPFTVAGIDYIKTDTHRSSFLQHCPELVIVDEAHAATRPNGRGKAQQQRYELVRDIAKNAKRNLLLLTATPHSGLEGAFLSLVGLLDGRFERLSLQGLSEPDRDRLARHFVQRRRGDVTSWLGDTQFPTRHSAEVTYSMPKGSEYRKLFDDVYRFARELVQDGVAARRTAWRARVRYWAALALLRCVMSSPAAAEVALNTRAEAASDAELEALDDELFAGYVYDLTEQEATLDVEPTQVVEQGSGGSERARLRRFATRAQALRGKDDPKLQRVAALVDELLTKGFNPIVYCRYIATANYVADELRKALGRYGPDLRVLAVTGERSEEERDSLVAELSDSPRRVLVATDCLSEGINLQDAFDAVVHYDLPWNPNRLEQREGRVDRFGQRRAEVRTALVYGQDNPMDEAVMTVLLRKAVQIHRDLGTSVPLPADSDTVVEQLIATLFPTGPQQLELFDVEAQVARLEQEPSVNDLHTEWDRAVEREKQSRSRFAQRRIKPDEVARELEETDAVLGDPATVREFVLAASERLNAALVPVKAAGKGAPAVWRLSLAPLPLPVREQIEPLFSVGRKRADSLLVTFEGPPPEGVTLVGRNHPLTAALADYLLGSALAPTDGDIPAARCGLMRTTAVTARTTLVLLRVRMLIESKVQPTPALAEELVVAAYRGRADAPQWLAETEALRLLAEALPDQAVTAEDRRLGIANALGQMGTLKAYLAAVAQERATRLEESHNRVRQATGGGRARVTPYLPADILGVYVLQPVLPRARA